MTRRHAVLRGIAAVVEEVLVPVADIRGRERAEAHGDHPHVQEEDLRPGVEGDVELGAALGAGLEPPADAVAGVLVGGVAGRGLGWGEQG